MTARPDGASCATSDEAEYTPKLRDDFVRRDVDGACVVWPSLASQPTVLDPVAAVMLDVIDAEASIRDLAVDVHEAVGVSLEHATRQITRIVELFHEIGLLETPDARPTADEAIARRELFVSVPTPCSESTSRLGTVTLVLEFGAHTVRIACDSRRGARTLRNALRDHVVDEVDDAPLAFVLTAPQGLKRTHRLVDRTGFVLSETRGLDAGVHALASHLTALLPPAPGTVRFRSRAVVANGRTIVCLFPLLFFPEIDDRRLARAGLGLVDRLVLDVDVRSGQIVNPPIPWPELRDLGAGPAHVGTGDARVAADVIATAVLPRSRPPTRAEVAAELAGSGLHGSRAELLDAAIHLVQRAELRMTSHDAERVTEFFDELGGARS